VQNCKYLVHCTLLITPLFVRNLPHYSANYRRHRDRY